MPRQEQKPSRSTIRTAQGRCCVFPELIGPWHLHACQVVLQRRVAAVVHYFFPARRAKVLVFYQALLKSQRRIVDLVATQYADSILFHHAQPYKARLVRRNVQFNPQVRWGLGAEVWTSPDAQSGDLHDRGWCSGINPVGLPCKQPDCTCTQETLENSSMLKSTNKHL